MTNPRVPPDATVELTEVERLHYAVEAERCARACDGFAFSLREGVNPSVVGLMELARAGRFIDDLLQQYILEMPES